MNPPVENDLPPSERFVDAALSEHARLGCDGEDVELIHRILRETVYRSSGPARSVNPSRGDLRIWVTGGVLVAALVAFALVLLSSLEVGRKERPSDEFHFLVRFSESAELRDPSAGLSPPMRLAERFVAPLNLVADAASHEADPLALVGSFERITSMESALEIIPSNKNWVRQENFRITADLSRASTDRLVYEGHVVVEHPLFRIEAQEVSVPVSGESRTGSQHPLLARRVKVTQTSPSRVAFAKELRFDAVSGTLELTGVDTFETAEGKLRQFAPGDRLVLDGEKFTVESPPLMRYAAPPLVAP